MVAKGPIYGLSVSSSPGEYFDEPSGRPRSLPVEAATPDSLLSPASRPEARDVARHPSPVIPVGVLTLVGGRCC